MTILSSGSAYTSFSDGSSITISGPASADTEAAIKALKETIVALGGAVEPSKPSTLDLLDRNLSVDEICQLRKAGLI